MTIFTDCHYCIGAAHLFCQDYAIHATQPFPHIILADGCSAAPNSDIGARLLVLNAQHLLAQFAAIGDDMEAHSAQHWPLGQRLVRRAARHARMLGVDADVLDATLLIAWCQEGKVYVHLYGDGCIAVRNSEGAVAVLQVEYADNAPYYLSYLLDAERDAMYREQVADLRTAQTIHYWQQSGTSYRPQLLDTPSVFRFDLNVSHTVAVATDGLYSFVNLESGERLSLLNAAERFLDFTNIEDEFVKRRTYEALNEYRQQQIVNLDDVGWGAFVYRN